MYLSRAMTVNLANTDEENRHACEQIHLDSGLPRYYAHRFYLNHGFRITSHHFSLSGLNEE